jgi:hypothetical protein
MFEICSETGHRITDYFSDDAIVSGALTYLLGIKTGTARLSTGAWAWSAVFQHDSGSLDHFDDESHFRILLRLIDEAPWEDAAS